MMKCASCDKRVGGKNKRHLVGPFQRTREKKGKTYLRMWQPCCLHR